MQLCSHTVGEHVESTYEVGDGGVQNFEGQWSLEATCFSIAKLISLVIYESEISLTQIKKLYNINQKHISDKIFLYMCSFDSYQN